MSVEPAPKVRDVNTKTKGVAQMQSTKSHASEPLGQNAPPPKPPRPGQSSSNVQGQEGQAELDAAAQQAEMAA